ncbi:WhiB family transcriptional regulator [Streptomyces rimosus]|uniref:WhiB family transcriptional regulator n=1 Tax=Streptomyces rimosus TaxID=1927 RepID=UPI00067E4BBA|nr:WhiB family transcriptional regulator [Streptomyces rimosus]
MSVPDFMLDALCARTDPEAMFPDSGAVKKTEFAKGLCARCPVQDRCLEYALAPASRVEFGVMGGLTEVERKALVKERSLGKARAIDYGPIRKAAEHKAKVRGFAPAA